MDPCDLCVEKDFLKCKMHKPWEETRFAWCYWGCPFYSLLQLSRAGPPGSSAQFYLRQPGSSSEWSTLLTGKLIAETQASPQFLIWGIVQMQSYPVTSWETAKVAHSQPLMFGEMPSSKPSLIPSSSGLTYINPPCWPWSTKALYFSLGEKE